MKPGYWVEIAEMALREREGPIPKREFNKILGGGANGRMNAKYVIEKSKIRHKILHDKLSDTVSWRHELDLAEWINNFRVGHFMLRDPTVKEIAGEMGQPPIDIEKQVYSIAEDLHYKEPTKKDIIMADRWLEHISQVREKLTEFGQKKNLQADTVKGLTLSKLGGNAPMLLEKMATQERDLSPEMKNWMKIRNTDLREKGLRTPHSFILTRENIRTYQPGLLDGIYALYAAMRL